MLFVTRSESPGQAKTISPAERWTAQNRGVNFG
jgi:hypothetical protein